MLHVGFDLIQKEGRYKIEFKDKDFSIFQNILHFSHEEVYLLTKSIDELDINNAVALKLKRKLTSFLNQDQVVEAYLKKEKSIVVQTLNRAINQKKQIAYNYSSGNSQTVRNRRVEPFEFKDDYNLVWAFDIDIKQNRSVVGF